MKDHVRILAMLNIVFGALGVIVGIGLLLFFGGLGAFASVTGSQDPNAYLAFPVLGAIGGFVFMILLVVSAPQIIGGIGLLKMQPWARILMIVLSALSLLQVPIGTAIGAYGLWVLLNEETVRIFEAESGSRVPG